MNKNLVIYVIYISVIISLLALALQPMFVIAEATPIVHLSNGVKYNYQLGDTVPEFVVDEIIARHATGTKAYQMKRTIWCESGFKNIQSNVITRGVREPSYGLVQIHQPSHPHITREQALDPEFAIKFMSDNWGRVAWYGYIKATDSCNDIYK